MRWQFLAYHSPFEHREVEENDVFMKDRCGWEVLMRKDAGPCRWTRYRLSELEGNLIASGSDAGNSCEEV